MATPGPRVIALRRAAVDTGSLTTVLVTVLVVCTLVSGVVASLPALQAQAFRSAMRQLPADDAVVEVVSSYDAADPGRQDGEVRDVLQPLVAPAGGVVVRRMETVGHREAPSDRSWSFLAVTGGDVVEAGSGRLPAATAGASVEVAVPEGTRHAPAVGEHITLVSPLDGSRVRARVVGSWRARAEQDRAVGGSDGSLLVAAGEFEDLAARASSVRWRALPAYDRLESSQLDDLLAAAQRVDHDVAALEESRGGTIRVENPLVDVLQARGRELLAQRMLLLVPALLLLLLGAVGAVLVAAALAENRRGDETLLRSRGAGRRQVTGPTALEAGLLCLLGGAAGPPLATSVVRIGGTGPTLQPLSWAAGAVAAAVCWIALVTPAAARALTGDRGEQLVVERQRRRRLTALLAGILLLVALGGVAVVRLRGFSSAVAEASSGPGQVDPLVVASPSLLLLALVTVLVLALLPLLFRLTEVLVRTRGLVLALGTRAVSRAPGKAVPLALAVALVAGGVSFATAEGASQRQAREDRAAYVVGADLRVTAPPSSLRATEADERKALRTLDGVTDVAGVHRELDFVDDVATEVLVVDLDGAVGRQILATATSGATPADPSGATSGDAPGGAIGGLQDDMPTDPSAVPVAITQDLADGAALTTGDTFRLTVGDAPTTLQVVRTLPALPTVTDGRAGVLLETAELARHSPEALGDPRPDEWWLAVRDAGVEKAAAALRARPDLADDVLTRGEALRRLAADPGTGGSALADVMTVAATGAMLIGGVLLLSVVVLRRREREEQSTFLRALGAGERDVTLAVATEYTVTIGGGLLAGCLAGVLTAAVALHATALGAGGRPLVPAPSLHVPWVWTSLLLGLLLVVPVVTLLAATLVGARRTRAGRTGAGRGGRA